MGVYVNWPPYSGAAHEYCRAKGIDPFETHYRIDEFGSQRMMQNQEIVAREMHDLHLMLSMMKQAGLA